MNTFKFVGKIKKLEEKNNRKFIETVEFPSGWMLERVKFRVICGDCSEIVELGGGKWQDDSRNKVLTYFSNGDAKSQKAEVAWKDRFDPAVIDKIPHYKRYTVDLSSNKIREDLQEQGRVEEVMQLAQQKYTFITDYDFAIKVEELLKTGAFGDDNYVISGNVEYEYSNKNDQGTYYRKFKPTSIYKASDSDQVGCFGKIDLYYVKDEVVGETLENGDIPVTGYTQFYDRMSKENFYAPINLRIKPTNEKKSGFVSMLTQMGDDEADVLVLGTSIEYYNGSEKTAITENDFTDEQKQLISWGLVSKEEVIKEMGGNAYGERVNYIYLLDLVRGYTKGPQSTDVSAERLTMRPDGKKKDGVVLPKKTEKFDLFDDEDII